MTSQDTLVLGADLSTDGIEYLVVDPNGAIAATGEASFVQEFGGKYGFTKGGYTEGEGGEVRIPYGLLPDALDCMLVNVVRKLGARRKELRAVCVSLQQHGMCCWRRKATTLLTQCMVDSRQPLSKRINECFATQSATSWRDTATRPDCHAMEQELSADAWARITGSSPMQSLRFLGAQATRLHRIAPREYDETGQFTVLASAVASILHGVVTYIGLDEASCTLTMNLQRGAWSTKRLKEYLPPNFFPRLPVICAPGRSVGTLAPYWMQRYDLPACDVVLGMGDNPAAMLTMANEPGQWGISLGSSGTVYSEMTGARFDPTHNCHVLRSAIEGFMGMYVTLACGKVADEVRRNADLQWPAFDHLVSNPPCHGTDLMIFPESDGQLRYRNCDNRQSPACPNVVTRSIVTNMYLKSRFMGKPREIVVTGGFATEPVAEVVADIFEAPVYIAPKMNRVAWGSAVMALHRLTGESLPIVAARLCPKGKRVEHNPARRGFYQEFAKRFQSVFA